MEQYAIRCEDMSGVRYEDGRWIEAETGEQVHFMVNVDGDPDDAPQQTSILFEDFNACNAMAQKMADTYGPERVLVLVIDSSCAY